MKLKELWGGGIQNTESLNINIFFKVKKKMKHPHRRWKSSQKKKISRQSFEGAERVMLVIPHSRNVPTATPTDIHQLWRTNRIQLFSNNCPLPHRKPSLLLFLRAPAKNTISTQRTGSHGKASSSTMSLTLSCKETWFPQAWKSFLNVTYIQV